MVGMVTGVVAGPGHGHPGLGLSSARSAALVLGACGSLVCFFAVELVKHRLKIDDSLDVFAVHGVGGILGTCWSRCWPSARLGGAGYGAGMTMARQFRRRCSASRRWRLVGLVSLVLVAAGAVRAAARQRRRRNDGLDMASHGERAYDHGRRYDMEPACIRYRHRHRRRDRPARHDAASEALLAIRGEGGLPLANGDRLMPEPVLLGRNREKLAALAARMAGLDGAPTATPASPTTRSRSISTRTRPAAGWRARGRDRRGQACLYRKAPRRVARRGARPWRGAAQRAGRQERRRAGQVVPART